MDAFPEEESELFERDNQLVAYIGEPGNGLKVILDAFVKVRLCTIYVVKALLCNDADPFGQAYFLKTVTQQVKQ